MEAFVSKLLGMKNAPGGLARMRRDMRTHRGDLLCVAASCGLDTSAPWADEELANMEIVAIAAMTCRHARGARLGTSLALAEFSEVRARQLASLSKRGLRKQIFRVAAYLRCKEQPLDIYLFAKAVLRWDNRDDGRHQAREAMLRDYWAERRGEVSEPESMSPEAEEAEVLDVQDDA